MKYGFFSSKAKEQIDSCIFESISGENVEVTHVTELDNYTQPHLYDDEICLGVVVNWVSGKLKLGN